MVAKETPVCDFGSPAPDFSLRGVDGRTHTFETCRGERGTLVMFICNHCPYVKATIGRIVRDARELLGAGVGSVAVMSNDTVAYPADGLEHMTRLARDEDFPFPYLLDETQDVARAYGAVCTPDFLGFNAAGLLQYRGRLDAGRLEEPPAAAPRELFAAMSEIAATGTCTGEQHPSIGCSIKWR